MPAGVGVLTGRCVGKGGGVNSRSRLYNPDQSYIRLKCFL